MDMQLRSAMSTPIEYQPFHEQIEPDEAETQAELVATLRGIMEKTSSDSGTAVRSVHAKSHGVLYGRIEILPNLPPELAQGLGAQPGEYDAAIRLSTSPGDILADSVSTPRGMSLKIVGLKGERTPDAPDATTQDFVMINGPVFMAPNPKKFLSSLKLLAATTDHAEGLKKVFSAVLRGAEKVIEAVGGESGTLKGMGGHPETHPLGETFYTQVPILWGDYMGKASIVPVSPSLTALTDAPLNVNGKPNGLREAVVEYFATQPAEWDLRVQLCTDLEKMPIEDASVEWPQELSPYRTVARIRVAPQAAWSDEKAAALDEGLSFSPWHALAAHRPIGGVMRARRAAYPPSARFRAEFNGVPNDEPTDLPSR
jgi:hypothetical protein